MKPLEQISAAEAKSLEGVFFDLDDTLLDQGRLSEAAYGALFRLQDCGLRLIPLTGRPASWGELVARMWPVEAAIAENGAVAFGTGAAGQACPKLEVFDSVSPEVRATRRAALQELVLEARRVFPELIPADDVGGRLTDFTFDIGEHHCASEETIRAARAFAHRGGARTTRSSVHLHFTFDHADKATGALGYLRRTGGDPTRGRRNFAFIGDSDNDAPAFAAFALTVGVRNVHGHFSIPPRYVTQKSSSEGFIEFSKHLFLLRQS